MTNNISQKSNDTGNSTPRISFLSEFVTRGLIVFVLFAVFLGGYYVLDTARERDQRDLELARQLGSWVGDRMVLVGEDERIQLLRSSSLQQRGVRCGLYNMDGTPVYKGSGLDISKLEVSQVMHGQRHEAVMTGRVFHIGTAPLRAPLARISVVVAKPASPWYTLESPPVEMVVLLFGFLLFQIAISILLSRYMQGKVGLVIDRIRFAVALAKARKEWKQKSGSLGFLSHLRGPIEKMQQRLDTELAIYIDARHEVETMDGRRSDLLTAVSKDLYKPIGAVIKMTESLLNGDQGALKESQIEDLEIIQKSCIRLRSMMEEILDLSSLLTGEITFDSSPVDIGDVAREVVQEARGQIGAKKLAVSFSQTDQRPKQIWGNRQRIWQIVSNLVSNGIKFTESGEVSVSVSLTEDGYVQVCVNDTGEGIPPQDLNTIFRTFQQSGTKAGRNKGSGLGLAICLRLVELHKGEISVDSAPGKGAQFTVSIPEAT